MLAENEITKLYIIWENIREGKWILRTKKEKKNVIIYCFDVSKMSKVRELVRHPILLFQVLLHSRQDEERYNL